MGDMNENTRKGLVQVYTGNGKGKTSAALGSVIRALGQGWRVCIVSFMKGDYPYGEYVTLERLSGLTVAKYGRIDFVDPGNVAEVDKAQAELAMYAAREAVMGGKYDLVVLDEINIAAGWGLLNVDDVLDLIRSKPGPVELILTGRYANPRIIERADLVTEMVEVKHPYRQGIEAQQGVEY